MLAEPGSRRGRGSAEHKEDPSLTGRFSAGRGCSLASSGYVSKRQLLPWPFRPVLRPRTRPALGLQALGAASNTSQVTWGRLL